MDSVYILTIQPGLFTFEEPIKRYIKRENYGGNMTIYKFDNRISAILAKNRLENEGYNVQLANPDGSITNTISTKIFAGTVLSSNQ